MRLVYRVISCDGLGAWIDRLHLGDLALGDGKMASSWQLIPNSCHMQYHENVMLSTRDREEYTGHEKL